MSGFTADTGILETPWNGVGHCIIRQSRPIGMLIGTFRDRSCCEGRGRRRVSARSGPIKVFRRPSRLPWCWYHIELTLRI